MFSNYPAGVSDSHPYFNPPPEVMVEVECGSEEATVVPVHVVKTALRDLQTMVHKMQDMSLVGAAKKLPEVEYFVTALIDRIEELEDNGDYECPYSEEIELPGQTAEAEWTCPVCGNDHTEDTVDEGPDPDRGWDDRYDD